jgi:hypothetical protein
LGMKIGIKLGLLALLLLCANLGIAQTTGGDPVAPGIVLVSETVKTNVYEIKLQAVGNTDRARTLDAAMLSKQGILTCVTNPTTRICRVEVLKAVTERNLREIVATTGLSVAKTFTE